MAASPIERPKPQVIRFVLPETIPYQPPELQFVASTAPAAAPDVKFSAARPFVMAGSSDTRARAQQCLAQAVYYEAASEGVDGQRAVAQVVMNRLHHPAWPASVCGVVYQGSERLTGCQFTFTCDGSLSRPARGEGWARANRVARAALAGYVHKSVGLATHYHTLAVNPSWASSLDTVGTIGAHRFYRGRGAGFAANAFVARHDGLEPTPFAQSAVRLAANPSRRDDRPTLAVQPVAMEAEVMTPAAQAPIPAGAPAPSLPASGAVLERYRDSGSWLKEPGST
ncbi:cell wall hydrolase [Alteraurantiacibacter aquimixticola]|uniref:Cell wall hydrolase n=2 Tax=Alteraurantiacibacter aquimixticola TaxID=2489173 RepID=A0A4T3F398_9SPHN|nr:cell wall hydrolase [Alteraurantiacibacter aquimixticola]